MKCFISLVALALLGACNHGDVGQCARQSDCQVGEECSEGVCRRGLADVDGPVLDAQSPDANAADVPVLDVNAADASLLDAQSPDANAADVPVLDVNAADASLLDVNAADGSVLDASVLDVVEADALLTPDVQSGFVAADRPTPPDSLGIVSTVSIIITTGNGSVAGTDSPIEVCLSEDHCFRFDTPDIDDFQVGKTDILHFDVDTERRFLTQMRLRTLSDPAVDNNRMTPACVEVLFDGEPQYCNSEFDGVHIGTGESAGERIEYLSALGLFSCTSCQQKSDVIVGAPETDTLRIWTRSKKSEAVGLRIGREEDLSDGVIVEWAIPKAEDDFNHTFVVDHGVEADTQYYFRVESDSENSDIGHLKSAPLPTSTTTRFAVGSCTRVGEQSIFGAIENTNPDFFVFLGDTHYANSNTKAAHWWRYRDFRWNAFARRHFLANIPTLSAWDDHDFLQNNSNGTCEGAEDIEEVFEKAWPNPLNEDKGIYVDYRYGNVHLFALDCRSFKPALGQCPASDPDCSYARPDGGARCGTDESSTRLDPNFGLLGRTQEQWLLEALSASDATFKILSCGTQWSTDGSRDSWAAFLPARDALIDEVARRNVEGVLFMSGDIHKSTFHHVQSRGRSIPEITSSGLSYEGYGTCQNRAARTDPDEFCFENAASFVLVETDSSLQDPTLTAKLIDEAGEVQHTWVIPRSSLVLE